MDVTIAHLPPAALSEAVEQSRACIVITDTKGDIQFVNSYFCQITGYSKDEVLGKNPRFLQSGYHPSSFFEEMWATLTAGKTWRGQILNKKKNGDFFREEATISPIFSNSQEIEYFIGVKHDITEQKRDKRELSSQNQLLNEMETLAHSGGWEFDVMSNKMVWTKGLYDLHNFPYSLPNNELAESSIKCYIGEAQQIIEKHFNQCVKEATSYDLVLPFKPKNKPSIFIRTRTRAMTNSAGKVTKVIGAVQDITEEIESQRALESTKEKLESIFTQTNVGIAFTDKEGCIEFCNDTFSSFFQLAPKELIGTSFSKITHPADLKREMEYVQEIAEGKRQQYNMNKRYLLPSGDIIWVNLSVRALRNQEGHLQNFVGVAINISEDKQREKKLTDSEERFKALVNSFDDIVYTLDTKQRHTGLYGSWIQKNNLDESFFLGKTAIDIFGKDKASEHVKANKKALSGTPSTYEWEMPLPDGNKQYVQTTVSPLTDQKGKVIGLLGLGRNITQLKEKELELRYALEGTQAGTWDWHIPSGKTKFNDRWAEIIGYSLKELKPISIKTWEKFSHPEDLKRSNTLLEKHFKGETEFYDFQARMKHKKGHWVWVWDRGKVVEWDDEGNPLRMVGTHVDITENKEILKALSKSKSDYKFLTDSLNHVLWSADSDGNIEYVNPKGLSAFGKSEKELIDLGWLSIVHPQDVEHVKEKWIRSVKTQKPYLNEQRMYVADGHYRWFKVSGTPQLLDGKTDKWIGISIDIDKEKRQKELLTKSQREMAFLNFYSRKMLRATSVEEVFLYIGEGLYELIDGKGIIGVNEYLDNNKRWILRYVEGLAKWEKYLPTDLQLVGLNGPIEKESNYKTYAKNLIDLGDDIVSITDGYIGEHMAFLIKKILPKFHCKAISFSKGTDTFGNVYIFLFTEAPPLNENVVKTFLDSASAALEKVYYAKDLETSNQRFEIASAATKDVIWDWDVKTDEFKWGKSVYQVFGNLELEGHIKDWWQNIHPDDYSRIEKELTQYMDNPEIKNYKLNYQFRRADKTYAFVEESGIILRDESGKPNRLIGAIRDITETQQHIKEIERQNKQLKTISWIQSHKVRSPLSRILEIAELLKTKDLDEETEKEVMDALIDSTKELDVVVSEIVSKTDLHKSS